MDKQFVLRTFLQLVYGAWSCSCCYYVLDPNCECDWETFRCSRLLQPADIILQNVVPKDTQRLIMLRTWVANEITLLPSNFTSLQQLRLIDFSENRISDIQAGTFEDLKRLQSVNLSYNRLKLLDSDAFRGSFPNFVELNLSYNKILVLTDNSFNSIRSMRKLDLRGNPILCISPGTFTGLHKVIDLRFRSANLSQIPVYALETTLPIRYLEIREMPRLFTIPDHAFRNTNLLRSLILEQVVLSAGEPSELAFFGLDNLTNLTFKSCNLSSVPRTALRDLENLLVLDLSYNPIQTIHPGDFTTLTNLRKLILHHLDLIEVKVEAFKTLQQLDYLDLSNNGLKRLYRDSFTINVSVPSTLQLAYNPWRCDCSLAWVINRSIHIHIGKRPANCASPEEFVGKSFSDIKEKISTQSDICQPPVGKLKLVEEDRTEQVGNSFIQSCRYNTSGDSKQLVTYTWYRNGKIIPVQKMPVENMGHLLMEDIGLKDSGKYECVIRSAGGEKVFKLNLKVKESPFNRHCSPSSRTSTSCGCVDDANTTASTTALVGVVGFIIAFEILLALVYFGYRWNKRRIGGNPRVISTEVTRNGCVLHRVAKPALGREQYKKGVVFGGQGIYSRPPEDLNARRDGIVNVTTDR